jgi:mRNA interferase RelE/StbE
MKTITFRKAAAKTLRRIPVNEARRIRAKIDQYAADPASQAANIKKLQGREGFQLRVAEWRVIFAEDGTVIDVIEIGPRGRIYE